MSLDDRRRRARRVQTGLTYAAGGVGGAIGAAKLRDAYKEEHPDRFAGHVRRVQARVNPERAERVGRFLTEGKPRFRTLLAASVAGSAAAAADQYHQHVVRQAREERQQRSSVTKDAFGVERPDLVDKSLTRGLTATARTAAHGAHSAASGVGQLAREVTSNPQGRAAQALQHHPRATLAAVVAYPHAAAHARAVAHAAIARSGAKAMSDSERAGRLAGDLAPFRTPEAPKNLWRGLRQAPQQRRVHTAAVAANPDTKKVTGAAERYSANFRNARKVRQAAERGSSVPSARATALRPRRSTREADAHTLGSLTDASRHASAPTLYRSVHGTGDHRVGDVVDFGRMSSWTSDRKVTERIGAMHTRAARNPLARRSRGIPRGASQRVYRREGGSGANLSGATRTFQQNEWLAGGKHVVTSTPTKGSPYYGVKPVQKSATASAFGIEHGPVFAHH